MLLLPVLERVWPASLGAIQGGGGGSDGGGGGGGDGGGGGGDGTNGIDGISVQWDILHVSAVYDLNSEDKRTGIQCQCIDKKLSGQQCIAKPCIGEECRG